MLNQQHLLCDREIMELCRDREHPMIAPFSSIQCGKPSWGLGSCGYDFRLGQKVLEPQLLGPKAMRQATLDPLNSKNHIWFKETRLPEDGSFVIGPSSFILGASMETFDIPRDIFALVQGKSSYARLGLVSNGAPAEPGWRGQYSLCLVNGGPIPIRVHVGQGIAQMIFFRTEVPQRCYDTKEAGGAYQGQVHPTLPS